jgi:hypothetical protein
MRTALHIQVYSTNRLHAQVFTWKSQYLQVVTETGLPYLLSISVDASRDPLTCGYRRDGKIRDKVVIEDYIAIDLGPSFTDRQSVRIARIDHLEADDGEVRTYAQAQPPTVPHYEEIGIFKSTDFELEDLAIG